MSRALQPYAVTCFNPPAGTRLPISDPTRDTRRTLGDNPALHDLAFHAQYAKVVPINPPVAGQGARFPQFPFVLPSDVAPDVIKPNILVALNHFSPSRHSGFAALGEPSPEPPKVVVPRRKIPRPQLAKRGTGGNFTIPAPLNAPRWPTSSQWLSNRMASSLPKQTVSKDWPYT